MKPLNPPAPIPSTFPQSEVSAPAESSNRRWFLWSAIGLTFLIFGITIGFFSAKFFSQSQSPSQLTSTPTPVQSPTPTPTPDPTADWKTYTNPKLGIEFKTQEKFSVRSENDKSTTIIFKEEIIPVSLTVSKTRSITPNSLPDCSIPHDNFQSCIFNKETQDIKLDNNSATKYRVSFGGPDNDWIIIQTHDSSTEIKMYDYGLYEVLDQILSTFKFTN